MVRRRMRELGKKGDGKQRQDRWRGQRVEPRLRTAHPFGKWPTARPRPVHIVGETQAVRQSKQEGLAAQRSSPLQVDAWARPFAIKEMLEGVPEREQKTREYFFKLVGSIGVLQRPLLP